MTIDGAPATFWTSTDDDTGVPLARLRAVAVMVVVCAAASGTEGTTNVPVVSLVFRICAGYDSPPAVIASVAGSTLAYPPLTSIDAAPVCVPGSGAVMVSAGSPA